MLFTFVAAHPLPSEVVDGFSVCVDVAVAAAVVVNVVVAVSTSDVGPGTVVNKVLSFVVFGVVTVVTVAVVVSTDVVVDCCVNVSIFLTRYVFLILGVDE